MGEVGGERSGGSASNQHTALSPDIGKGFLPFVSLSSLGLKDEQLSCVCVCVYVHAHVSEIGVQSVKKRLSHT